MNAAGLVVRHPRTFWRRSSCIDREAGVTPTKKNTPSHCRSTLSHIFSGIGTHQHGQAPPPLRSPTHIHLLTLARRRKQSRLNQTQRPVRRCGFSLRCRPRSLYLDTTLLLASVHHSPNVSLLNSRGQQLRIATTSRLGTWLSKKLPPPISLPIFDSREVAKQWQ